MSAREKARLCELEPLERADQARAEGDWRWPMYALARFARETDTLLCERVAAVRLIRAAMNLAHLTVCEQGSALMHFEDGDRKRCGETCIVRFRELLRKGPYSRRLIVDLLPFIIRLMPGLARGEYIAQVLPYGQTEQLLRYHNCSCLGSFEEKLNNEVDIEFKNYREDEKSGIKDLVQWVKFAFATSRKKSNRFRRTGELGALHSVRVMHRVIHIMSMIESHNRGISGRMKYVAALAALLHDGEEDLGQDGFRGSYEDGKAVYTIEFEGQQAEVRMKRFFTEPERQRTKGCLNDGLLRVEVPLEEDEFQLLQDLVHTVTAPIFPEEGLPDTIRNARIAEMRNDRLTRVVLQVGALTEDEFKKDAYKYAEFETRVEGIKKLYGDEWAFVAVILKVADRLDNFYNYPVSDPSRFAKKCLETLIFFPRYVQSLREIVSYSDEDTGSTLNLFKQAAEAVMGHFDGAYRSLDMFVPAIRFLAGETFRKMFDKQLRRLTSKRNCLQVPDVVDLFIRV